MTTDYTLTSEEMKTLMHVALGQEKADLVIRDAKLLNVYTGEFLENHAVSVKGKRIAYVGGDPDHTIGDTTEVIEANGKTLIPGLIDGHTHLAWLFDISEFLKYAIKGGTTTIITETMEPLPVMGYEGVTEFMGSLRDQPIKIFGTAPAMVSTSKAAFGIPRDTLGKLLEQKDILGLGESYWQALFQEPEHMLPVFEDTLRAGKVLEGHSAGASGKKLAAYLASGISSCHEPINADQVLERLRLGLHVMVREGSIRRDLEEIARIKDTGIDLRRLILVTDGVEPKDLMEKGCMEFLVQKAIDSGFDPIEAVQMATLNVAEHFSLDGLVGGIAPGRYADMVIIPDPRKIDAEYVISNGKIIARDNELLVSPRKHHFSERCLKSVRLPRKSEPADFSVRIMDDVSEAEVRVIELITDLVTREEIITLPITDHEIRADSDQDILKIAAVDRAIKPGKVFTGFIKGFRMKAGAMASSAAWDTSDIVVVGATDEDMAAAVNRIHDLQGGAVVCERGKILAEIPLPIMGLISDMPMKRLTEAIRAIRRAAAHLGVPFPDPLLTLITLTGAAIPYLRICEQGLVNLKDGKVSGLFRI